MIKAFIKTTILLSVVLLFVCINLSIFLIYSPQPNTSHYLFVKRSGNFTTAASNATTTANTKTKPSTTKSTKGKRKTPPVDSPIKYLTLSDGVIAYEIVGPANGYPVFQLHGVPGGKSWRHVNETQLLTQYNVKLIRFDRLGVGHSKPKQQQGWDWSGANQILSVFPQTKPVKYTVMKIAEQHLNQLIKHIVQPDEHYSLVAYSMGAPYALAAAQSESLPAGLDSISLITPFGYLSEVPKGWCKPNEQAYNLLKHYGNKGELLLRVGWDILAKFGFVTHHSRWQSLFDECMSDLDKRMLFSNNTESDQWRNIFNETVVDLYMQTPQAQIDEAVRLFDINSWGFKPTQTSYPVKIFYTDNDLFAPRTMVEDLINRLGDKCIKQFTPDSSHFDLFAKSYEDALRFAKDHAVVLPRQEVGNAEKEATTTTEIQS